MAHTVKNIQSNEKVHRKYIHNEVESGNYLIKSGRYYVLTQMDNRVTTFSKIKKKKYINL